MNKVLHSLKLINKSGKENELDFYFGVLSRLSLSTKHIVNSKREPMTNSFHTSQSHKEKMIVQNRIKIKYNSSLYI